MMKPATEEFLYFLLWTAQGLSQPAWRNPNRSFESCAYRTRIRRRLRQLEEKKLIEGNEAAGDSSRLFRLTEAGRLAALGGIDPPARWSRAWDGRWRLVLFDVPEQDTRQRVRLRRLLKRLGFGYLQDSVWISPDRPESLAALMSGTKANAEMLVIFEASLAGGENDADLVQSAWNFKAIARTYERWHRVADRASKFPNERPSREVLKAWAKAERRAWTQVCLRDPFLPTVLLPAGYVGRKAWARRVQLLNALGLMLG